MAQPNKQAKSMSSRLMNMKFMQRSSASPSQTPSTPLEPPSKRQRLSNGTAHSTPSSTPRSRAEASEVDTPTGTTSPIGGTPVSSHLDETEWHLSIKKQEPTTQQTPLRIVSAGYSALDAGDSAVSTKDEDDPAQSTRMHGRRSFGKFNRRLEKQQNPELSSSDSEAGSESSNVEDDNEEDDESDDPTGAKAMIAQSRKEAGDRARAERKAKRKAEKAEAARLADERRKKQVKLNTLTSISGGGGTPGRQSGARDMKCFQCGQQGHMKKDCPQSAASRTGYR